MAAKKKTAKKRATKQHWTGEELRKVRAIETASVKADVEHKAVAASVKTKEAHIKTLQARKAQIDKEIDRTESELEKLDDTVESKKRAAMAKKAAFMKAKKRYATRTFNPATNHNGETPTYLFEKSKTFYRGIFGSAGSST